MAFLDPITGFFRDVNYVYAVEVIIILGILVFTGFVLHQLGVFQKSR